MSTIDATALPQGVSLAAGSGGLPCVSVTTPACTAQVYLHGAHITSWVPDGQQPVLWCSSQATYSADSAIRGGVPLCAPWFGPGRTGGKEPAHGYFRLAEWELTQADRDGDDVLLVFTLPTERGGLPGIEHAPADLQATYRVRLGAELGMELEIATPTQALELENALHAYLHVGDVRTVTLQGLDGARYADKAPGGRAVNAQSGPVEFRRETDRVYASTESVTVVDPTLARKILVTKDGSHSTIVWNPWERRAAEMSDFGDDEWTQMLCVEPGNALKGRVDLAPGERHTLRATISVDSTQ
ncbi:D-hexose-6-phosphate mutarotase [Gephyromycinifex aptenodytis]|uniref:D-hexose-6-phosphate mutarotase n=1 Tax=Gephyromycinifex aptenodytis TaxID=2716227 RepID=UPI0014479C0D|nr:D-hexose-6-phosphate mutarotase [Gephyromycinifex aptenodytis]